MDTGTLPTVAHDRLARSEWTDPNTGETTTSHRAGSHQIDLHGFNGLISTDISVTLRLTAQTMGNRYTDGISLDTLGELCDRLNATGLLHVTPDGLLGGTVRRADPFADVLGEGDVPAALRLLGRTSGPTASLQGRGNAVTLYHKLPDRQGKLRAYAKGRQMELAKHADFRTLYPAALASLDGRHRFEIEAKKYHAIRRIAGLADGRPMVRDVLGSTRQPVADALDTLLSTWTGRRRALHSLPTVPDSLDALLAMPSASPSADAHALLAALVSDLTQGDYDAATEAVRARYGQKNAHRLYPALRAACEAYGRPDVADAHADAVNVLRSCSTRIRQRETA